VAGSAQASPPPREGVADEKWVQVGKIVGVSGVRGEIKLESYTEPRTRIFSYQPWLLKSGSGEREIGGCRGREQGKGVVATLPGIEDRDAAALLVGAEIWVRRSALPRSEKGEYYWADLEGLEVETVEGAKLGRVSHLVATGANDVLVVFDGKRERLIPFVLDDYVKEVDFESGRMTVDWDPEF
jgi:16S rRNA processing protein RimM